MDNDFTKTNWYKKPTFSGRYLNFHSHHPIAHKIGIIYNIVDKCIKLSSVEFHQQNLKEAKYILLQNNYPLHLINKHMNIRINSIKNNSLHPPQIIITNK